MFCPNPGCIDFVQDGIHGEYVDTVTVCPKCGAKLVPEVPKTPPPRRRVVVDTAAEDEDAGWAGVEEPAPLATGPLVALAAFDYPDEVEPIAALLAANGIAAYQFLDDGRDFEDKGDVPTCTRLLVPQDQFRRASALVEQAEQEARAKL
jgi:hypothetical protein